MIYKIACVGNIKEQSIKNMLADIEKEINKNNKLIICQVPDEKIPKKASEALYENIKNAEGKRLLDKISKNDCVAALCVEGKKYSTLELKKLADRAEEREMSSLTFVIGGSLGLSDEVIKRADFLVSFSDMTFPHQLMRLMLADQIKLICDM